MNNNNNKRTLIGYKELLIDKKKHQNCKQNLLELILQKNSSPLVVCDVTNLKSLGCFRSFPSLVVDKWKIRFE